MKIQAFVCLSTRSFSTALCLSARRVRHVAVLCVGAFMCMHGEAQTAHFGPTTGVDFGSVNVGSASAAIPLSFTFDTAGALGSTAVLTQGVTGLDFADTGTGTCATNGTSHIYNVGDTCTVNVTFAPKYAGTRYGAAVLKDTGGNVIATGYVYGTGIGPQVAFPPGALTTIAGSGLDSPTGVAVDGSGNVYVTDSSNSRILKETLSGGSYTETVLLSSGLDHPAGLAIDGAGNLYIVDALNRRILKETVSVSGYTETVLVGSGLHSATGVAVDGSGNVYYCNSSSNSGDLGIQRVVKKTLSGGSYTDSTVADISTGLDDPIGVAVDGSGNVYIADFYIGKVWKETPSGGGYTQTTVGSGLNHPRGVAVDGRGNVYIADTGNLRVLKESPSAGSYTQTAVTTTLQFSWGLAVDGSGNIYIVDYDKSKVLKVSVADPPSLNFTDTNVGATSSDSPQTVTVENIGNANLTFPIPSTGNNPSISIGFTLGGSGTCPQLSTTSFASGTLAAGSSCTLPVSFSPTTSGINHGSVVLTDNALNANPSTTQTILLTGTGVGAATAPQPVLSPTSLAFNNVTTGSTSVAQIVTLSNPGTAALSITGISITGANSAQFTQTSNCGASLAAGASCSISVAFTPSVAASYSAALSVADNATGSPQMVALAGTGVAPVTPQAVLSPISLTFANTNVGSTAAALAVQLSNPGNAALTITGISIVGSGANGFAQTSNCGTTLAAGASCSISVTFTPSAAASYSAALSVTNNSTGSPQTVALAGAGVLPAAPQAVLSPTSLSFGSLTSGTTSGVQTTRLSNPGNTALSITGISIAGANSGQFAQTNNCGTSLAAGANCTISVAFTPAAVASYSATLSVTDNAVGSPHSVQLTGAGVSPPPTDFSIGASNSPQTVARGASAQYAITLTPLNGGFSNAITLSAAGLPAGATAVFSPASVTPNGSSANSTLTVATSTTAAFAAPSPNRGFGTSRIGGQGAVLALGILLLPWIKAKRLRPSSARLLRAALLLVSSTCLWGCGQGGFADRSPQQTYILTVTGTSGSTQHATTVTLILK
jgi:sugar lactone lactonase YvrE